MQSRISNKKIAFISLFVALAMICSYIESLIPINFGIPGVKLGLANVVSVVVLYLFSPLIALIVVILRVILLGILFGNMFSILYSLTGGVVSVILMYITKKTNLFSLVGVSIVGGVSHNLAQLFVAMVVIEQLKLSFYGPVLIISGIVTGTMIGLLCMQVIKRVETYVR